MLYWKNVWKESHQSIHFDYIMGTGIMEYWKNIDTMTI